MASIPADTNDDDDDSGGWNEAEPLPMGPRCFHGCAKIDEHRMIVLGGSDGDQNVLHHPCTCAIYDARTNQWTTLPKDMPVALIRCSVVANRKYVYVIGGCTCDNTTAATNVVYRLSLETYEWTVMAPMDTARYDFAAVLKNEYIYVFGGMNGTVFASAERYSIVNDTWEALPRMRRARHAPSAVESGEHDIIIVGGLDERSLEVFDITLQRWKIEENHRRSSMPGLREFTAAVMVKDRYLVMIGGCDIIFGQEDRSTQCFVYDCFFDQWSSIPESPMSMVTNRQFGHTATALDGKIFVVGGSVGGYIFLNSVESIDVHDLLEYAPLIYPLPTDYYNQLLQIGRSGYDSDVEERGF